MDPATPIKITGQIGRPNITWHKTITVKAGGNGNGVTSTATVARKTIT
jgi:hypothetical protein